MYRCILVPLDGTPFGESAIPHAASIALRAGAALQLVHVHLPPIIPSGAETAALPPVWMEVSRDEKRRYLEGVSARVTSTWGLQVEHRVMEGGVAAALERYARRCRADLIVMSTHGHTGLSRLWHQGVAEQLARDLPIPLLLVRPRDRVPLEETERSPRDLRNVLVLLDGSAESERIIEHAVALARPFAARTTLARVLGEASRAAARGHGGGEAGAHDLFAMATGSRQYLNAVAERLRRRGVDVATEVLVGERTAAAVLERIELGVSDARERVDVVALECPERRAMSRLLFSDTGDELLRECPVPLLMYQQPPARAAAGMAEPGLVGGA